MTDYSARLIQLYDAFIDNRSSPEETEEFFRLINEMEEGHPLKERIFKEYEKANFLLPEGKRDWQQSLDRILQKDAQEPAYAISPVRRVKRWMYAAAAILLLLTAGTVYYFFSGTGVEVRSLSQQDQPEKKQDLKPGKTGAVLLLADGTQISLDSVQNGVLASQGNSKIIGKNGRISYEKGATPGNEVLYNTISTPRGRQFSLVLSDGSKVWLNAASSIRYPADFSGNDRKVEITGEVYMEIASHYRKDQSGSMEKIPFVVQFNTVEGNRGEIQVLGTHFNINTYGDDRDVKATLLEGSIQLVLNDRHMMIKPGEQVTADKNGRMQLDSNADMDAVMAWKNGFFSFNNTDMRTLMNEIGRWYDVDVEYAGTVPDRKFGGEIARSSNASQVLKIMEESNVRFRIEEKKIIVLP